MKTKEIIHKYAFYVKKHLGQNFLIDDNILENIVSKSFVDEKTGVIEIGPGLGSLTVALAKQAKFVLAYEIDQELLPILDDTLKDYSNIKIINQDILLANIKEDINMYLNNCEKIYVIANIPYYITTEIIFRLLDNHININKMVLMMQEEVAMRLMAKPKTKEYNALSVVLQYKANIKKMLKVTKNSFYPIPKVDSIVLEIDYYNEPQYFPSSEIFFLNFVKSAFLQKRKTLVNNLVSRYQKERTLFEDVLYKNGFSNTIRAEEMSLDDLINYSNLLLPLLENGEVLDIYNCKREKQNKTFVRGNPLNEGEYHLIVIAIITDGIKILIQQRAKTRLCYPNLWSITGGAVSSGETSIKGVMREVYEEMGLKLPKKNFTLFKQIINGEHSLVDIYEVKCQLDVSIKLNEEVQDYRWVTKEEIDKLQKQKKFVDVDYVKIQKYFDKE